MKKCNKTHEELVETFLDNIDIAYDIIKDDNLKSSKEQMWENAYAITFTRSLYMFLTHLAKCDKEIEFQYLQKRSVFNDLTNIFYDGEYNQDYTGFKQVVNDYIKQQKEQEQDGEMA